MRLTLNVSSHLALAIRATVTVAIVLLLSRLLHLNRYWATLTALLIIFIIW